MDIRQLRYFTVLARELSFTRAAQKLHVSQPPLSYQIANLEADLGVRLFNRTSRTVELSEAGKALLPHAHAVLERIDDARSLVKRVAEGIEGRVQVGLAGSHFMGPFPRFIKQFRLRRPNVEVVLHEMQPAAHVQALRDSQLDLSLSRIASSGGALTSSRLWHDPLVCVLPPDHSFAGRPSLRLNELRAEDFVFLRLNSSAFAQNVFDACAQAGFTPRIIQQVVEIPAVLSLVGAGLGVGLVPMSLSRLRQGAVVLCPLEDELPALAECGDVYLLRRTADPSPAVTEFSDALQAWAKQRVAP